MKPATLREIIANEVGGICEEYIGVDECPECGERFDATWRYDFGFMDYEVGGYDSRQVAREEMERFKNSLRDFLLHPDTIAAIEHELGRTLKKDGAK